MYYLGIDGHGRYTKLLALDENLKVLGRHSGAPSDLRLQPAASVAHNITALVRELGRLTNTGAKDCGGLCFAAPAASVKTHEAALVKMFKNIGFTCGIKVVSVERAALAAKIGVSPGALILAGEDVSGYIWRADSEVFAGGYGRLIETGGSAYSIGIQALRHVVMSLDGRGEATNLTAMITKELGLKEPDEIIAAINQPGFEIRKVAEIARLVNQAAQAGDNAALGIEAQAAKDLALFGASLVAKAQVKGERTNLVMGGAVVLLNENVARQTSANLRSKFPDVQVLLADEKAELGAAMLAKQ